LIWVLLEPDVPAPEMVDEIRNSWPRILPGGILAVNLAGLSQVAEAVEGISAWAMESAVKVHFTPPHSYWICKAGGELPGFSVWNQQVPANVAVEHGFNPSICPYPRDLAKRVFAFRSVTGKWENGRIWLGLVDSLDLQFLHPPQQLDLEPPEVNCEDPRLFLFDDEVWLSYTVSDWSKGRTISRVRLVPLLETAENRWIPRMEPVEFASPFARIQEKNWIFFTDKEDRLLAHYSSSPEWRIHEHFLDASNEYIERVIGPPVIWPFGEIRGGTPFVEAPNGNLWTFFHSCCRHDPQCLTKPVTFYDGAFPDDLCRLLSARHRTKPGIPSHPRYFCGLLETCSRTFHPLRITPSPLLYLPSPGNGRCGNHVIWPAGAFREGDEVVVAYGMDDRTSHCCRFSAELLERLLVAL
jgi:predicted GH43/DUF377 family glycosyl hydrolase